MRHQDQHGLPVTAASAAAVAAYDRAVLLFAAYRADPLVAIEGALAEDPDFLMGHCLKGGLLATSTERAAEAPLRECIVAATRLLPRADRRERDHVAALQAWAGHRYGEAVARWGRIVAEHPRDLLALQLAHLGDFYLGQSALLRDRPASALPAWERGEPGWGFAMGMHAFGLEETGDYARAETVGRSAVENDPGDAWAVHAVTHVLEMQGRTGDGIAWLETTAPAWSRDNLFAFHNWWHLALYRLERGEHAEALALYDQRVRPGASQVILELIDATALLWRLQLRGVDVNGRWAGVAAAWDAVAEDGHYPFNDVHAALAYVGAGRVRDAEAVAMRLRAVAERGDEPGMMAREVALPVVQAAVAFARDDYAVCADTLLRVRGVAQRFGGSHAQRDLLALTALEAALRGGQRGIARALAAERLALKPDSPFARGQLVRVGEIADATRAAA